MISYVKIQRVDPSDPSDETKKKWHGQVVDNGILTLEDIARNIALRVTVQRADVEAALRAFTLVMRNDFLNGNSVKLNNIGTFKPTLRGSGTDDPLDWTRANLKAINVRFRRVGKIREKLSLINPDVRFVEVEKMERG